MNDLSQRIVVTGVGLVSAAGCDTATLLDSLRAGQSCLQPIAAFDTAGMKMTHAGEVSSFDPCDGSNQVRARTVDRGSQMALVAARQALAQATRSSALDLEQTGVMVGLSGAPQYQNLWMIPSRAYPRDRRSALYFSRSTPAFQADLLARSFGLGGPRAAFGSASVGGLLAVGHAMDLLRMGHATAMLVGGGEIQTLLNALGMDVIGMGAKGPCQPFYASTGMSFGEGAACLLLETLANARTRNAQPLAELVSSAASADAYHEISNDPAGKGLARSICNAMSKAHMEPGDIGWIRGSGTGHPTQDLAEAIALEECFDGNPPPITSTEPYFGHVNGVSPLLGLVAGIVAQQENIALALPLATGTQAECSLPLLAPGVSPHGDWLVTGVAFGGSNAALIAGPVKMRRSWSSRVAAIDIAGCGMVSGHGFGLDAFLAACRTCAPAASAPRRVDDAQLPPISGVDLRRREKVVRWSLSAVDQALSDAGLRAGASARIGLLIGMNRGPMTPYERFFDQIFQGEFNASTGRRLLKTGRFSVASEVAHAFGLQGYCGTMCPGVNGGVQLAAHGAELLRASPELDALLVVAADEWNDLGESLYQSLGLVSAPMHAYDPGTQGTSGGEGAAALLLVRSDPDSPVSGWARIAGTALGGDTGMVPDMTGRGYAKVIGKAVRRARLTPAEVDFALGQGCGWNLNDMRELAALSQLRPDLPLSGVLGHTGLAESAGGLFGVIAAAAALRDGCLPPLAAGGMPQGPADFVTGVSRLGAFHHALLCGSTERGAHAAVLLQGKDQ
ncbi:beta-ketoacyl synthase N-terminal-like domain-containing protein [Paraburkholderia ribeironis]|nr:beta-ketoacyl synthase N-terminal-like domain-containing protein [Paraburkholderia ribeironis]